LGEPLTPLESPFRDCCARRSRTGVDGVDGCSFLPTESPDTFTAVPLDVRFALGMPRFSARLVAIEDWGSLRRDVGGVGEDGFAEEVRGVEAFDEADVVEESEACFVTFFFSSRGASLIRPASLRWWSSRRLRMRSAYTELEHVSYTSAHHTHLDVVRILSGITKGSRSEIVLLPRRRNAGAGCGSRGVSGVVMSLGEVCRLHSGVSGKGWTCSSSVVEENQW
jgi:hypothetical protein